MADMEEREETYLKLFYNRHPGLGAIEPAPWCHLPGQPGILIVFWKQSVTAEWGLISELLFSVSWLLPEVSVLRTGTVFYKNQAGDNAITCRKYQIV